MIDRTNIVRVPNSRIGVIIGPKGSTKQELEELSSCDIDIDSETGEVAIMPREDQQDPITIMKVGEVIKAIGRGFTPQQAQKLFADSIYLEIISLRQIVGTSNKALSRVRSRLIGSQGKTRKTIEEYTTTSVVIAGSTVSIIGKYINMIDAKEAIMRIINGANQSSVYAWLEERKKELMRADEDDVWTEPDIDNLSPEELDALLREEKDSEDIDLSEEFDQIVDED